MFACARWVFGQTCVCCRGFVVKNIKNLGLLCSLLLSVGLGCSNQKNSNSVATTNEGADSNSHFDTKQSTNSAFKIPPESVPATDITRDFDSKHSDLKLAIKKWRNKHITFHGRVYSVERDDNGNFKISLAGHDSWFTVFCNDIPASQSDLVGNLKEDQTIIAINGVILGSGTTGLVPGRVDDDVKAERCKIVE